MTSLQGLKMIKGKLYYDGKLLADDDIICQHCEKPNNIRCELDNALEAQKKEVIDIVISWQKRYQKNEYTWEQHKRNMRKELNGEKRK